MSLGNPFEEFSVELINEAEAEFDRIFDCPELLGNSPQNDEKQSDRLLASIVAWVKVIPKFSRLNREDQICLLRAAWNEVLIADIAHRSIDFDVSLTIFFLVYFMVDSGCFADRKKRVYDKRTGEHHSCRNYFRSNHDRISSTNEEDECKKEYYILSLGYMCTR